MLTSSEIMLLAVREGSLTDSVGAVSWTEAIVLFSIVSPSTEVGPELTAGTGIRRSRPGVDALVDIAVDGLTGGFNGLAIELSEESDGVSVGRDRLLAWLLVS